METVYVASLSGGKDSIAMVLLLLEQEEKTGKKLIDECVYFNSGMDFRSVCENVQRIRFLMEKKGKKCTILEPNNNWLFDMLIRPVRSRETGEFHYGQDWCGQCRWMTGYKTSAIKKYLDETYRSQNIRVIEYIGIAADEPSRIRMSDTIRYPLVDHYMTEADCLQYCYDHGFYWYEDGYDLYTLGFKRLSCFTCQNKTIPELRLMWKYLNGTPTSYWQILRGLQTRIDRPFRRLGETIFDLEKRFEQEEVNNLIYEERSIRQ